MWRSQKRAGAVYEEDEIWIHMSETCPVGGMNGI